MIALLMPPPASNVPGWICVIVLAALIVAVVVAIIIDMREESPEEMVRHLFKTHGGER